MCLSGCAHRQSKSKEQPEGQKWVHQLTLHGEGKVSVRDLRKHLALRSPGWWPIGNRQEYDEGNLRIDLRRIIAYCNERGYFDARVVSQAVEPHGEDAVDVIIVFDEGEPTRVVDVVLTGADSLDEPAQRHLRAAIRPRVGDVFNYQAFTASQGALKEQLRQRGYAYVEARGKAAVDRTRHAASISVAVNLGPPVTIGGINVTGNDGIPAAPIRHRLTFRTGDRFDPRELDRSETRIYALGVFSAVAIKLPLQPQPVVDTTVQVEPAQRLHDLRIGGGVGVEQRREEARIRAEWASHNFLGGLRTLRLMAKPAYVLVPSLGNVQRQGFAADVLAQLVQPDLLGTALTAQGNVGYQVEIQDGYNYQGPRAGLGLERTLWRDRLLLSVAWNLQYFNFYDIDTAVFNPETTPLGFGFQNPYRLAYLQAVAELDLRDNRLNPHQGAWLGTHLELGAPPLGGDFSYFRVTPELRGYIPFGPYVSLALRALAGGLYPSARNRDSPITRRFFLGGPSDQRGFSFGRLAPQLLDPATGNRIPIGGDGEVLFSAEVRLGTFQVWGQPLAFVGFADAGDVTPEVSQLQLLRLHVAVGPDILYQTPVGPLRAGVGIRLNRLGETGPNGLPNPDPGDRVAFHITFGEAF